ncbi:major facilitator superfamily domain-containing protein [Mycena olivaceomarginata]|nr:major facilitator superfamily domain-containing protein [Mycena olivaceomarginata]
MPKVETIVFLSLVLDLFAFTIPLPLFPRIIEFYSTVESSDPNGFLSRTLQFVSTVRGFLYKPSTHSQKWDIVLLGGLMGSVFSTLQFLVSPKIGSLSDKYGRKRILLLTMIGNILSAVLWLQSTTFSTYMLSRVVGGLSEGNVQLAIAILSDVSTPANRSKALAHVGIAFAICFCIGPPIGAYFASRPLPASMKTFGLELNPYAVPAAITVVLLVLETLFLVLALPETKGKRMVPPTEKPTNGAAQPAKKASVEQRVKILKTLNGLHFLFLGVFSGVEFTLTFLTFDLFDWNNKQNGALIGSIGIISALLQGGYVRRATSKIGEGVMARRGVSSCAAGLVLLALLPQFISTKPTVAFRLLQGAAVCMAFTSATVVNSLTAFASLQCDESAVDPITGKPTKEHAELAKGKALGKFRSSGQLGRAIGPLLACASYWTFGPSITYTVSAIAMTTLSVGMRSIAATKSS